ncbi:DNA polymerase I [Candidatus Enterovibrio altilux]|uniref:DNA polymerase I n=1 Tax=Candidatus Enterovibrio altilux TaxID=1927128 RepID=A0A291B8Q6_9GAMM|nr:DNA polymerase I [Candidatus Enterovibrio luxaltus]ATF09388.1 DNA polymerase I [Candidatus Enterovibrio luxaltus]
MVVNFKTPLILVDGSSYLYRAYYAFPKLTNTKGEPTGAVYGVINMLRSLVKQYPQSNVTVIFDAQGKTFRDDMYSAYKAHRPQMPDDLRGQIVPLHQIIKAMGFPMIMIEGIEADDVIGTLATQGSAADMSILISTSDKDMTQLVDKNINLINTMTNIIMNLQGVYNKYGFGPKHIVDYLALMGDTVDNIPGVPGIGDKIATALITGIGGLNKLYNNLDKIADLGFRGSKTIAKKLENNREQVYLSYALATIKLDYEFFTHPKKLINDTPDNNKLVELFTELNFTRWLAEAQSSNTGIDVVTDHITMGNAPKKAKANSTNFEVTAINCSKYNTILMEEDFHTWMNKLRSTDVVAFDTETDNLDYMKANLVGLSFAIAPGVAAYVPVAHDYLGVPKQLDRDWVLAEMKSWLEDASALKVGQNLKYDASILTQYDINLKGIAFDTMLESYVYNSVAGRHDIYSLSMRYLQHTCISFKEIAGKGKKQLTLNQIKLEQATEYVAEYTDIILHLHLALLQHINSNNNLKIIFEQYEMPLVPVLSRIERHGVLVDSRMLAKQSLEITARLKILETEIFKLAGEKFNLNSPKQLQVILFEKMDMPVIKKTSSGTPSTNAEVLQKLALTYPIPKCILEYRGLAKLKSTYTDKLPKVVNPATKRVHTSYNQAATATGRLASTNPNLQNIPIRNKEGRRIRQAFIAPQGKTILAVDYSQIELRIMAHLSGDEALIDAFRNGKDIHSTTAAEVMKIDINDVTLEMRRHAKSINFGLIYGMSAMGLAKQLKIPRGAAQQYMERYFERYPNVLQYMEKTRIQASEQGYVETIFGRRVYLPDINSSNNLRRKAAERAAINAPMQGTAADIIKRAMIFVDRWIQQQPEGRVALIMQVHDELVLEVDTEHLAEVKAQICRLMESVAILDIPLIAEPGSGKNWDSCKH